MKTISMIALFGLTAACGLEPEPETDPDLSAGVHGDDGGELADAVVIDKTELARIDLGSGELVYWVDKDGPTAGQITVLETSVPDKNGQLFLRDSGDLSPLEMYLEATTSDTPVPRPLTAAAESIEVHELALERPQVDKLTETVQGVAFDQPTISNWSAATMCNQGVTSAMFANEICTADNWTKNFCHNGTWYSVTDATGNTHKAEWSRGRTLACGANGRQRHYYKFWGVWYKTIDGTVPSGTVYRFTRKGSTGLKLERKITHSRTASGFVRGSSHFYRFPF